MRRPALWSSGLRDSDALLARSSPALQIDLALLETRLRPCTEGREYRIAARFGCSENGRLSAGSPGSNRWTVPRRMD